MRKFGFSLLTFLLIAGLSTSAWCADSTGLVVSQPMDNLGQAPAIKMVQQGEQRMPGSAAYGMAYYPSINQCVYFGDYDVPGTWTTLGDISAYSWFAGDFNAHDHSTIYCTDYATNTMSAVTFPFAVSTVGACTPTLGTWSGHSGGTSNFYGLSTDISASRSYTIDVTTGAATVLFDVTTSPGGIDCAANEGDATLYVTDIVNDTLEMMDIGSGTCTTVGALGININYAQGLDYDRDFFRLIGCVFNLDTFQGEMHDIDYTTGAATLIGANNSGAEVCAFSIVDFGGVTDLFLSPANSSRMGPSPSTVTHPMSLLNMTGSDGTFTLTIAGNTWATRTMVGGVEQGTIFVANGDSGAFDIEVDIPGGQAPGTFDDCTCTADGNGYSDMSDIHTEVEPDAIPAYCIDISGWPDSILCDIPNILIPGTWNIIAPLSVAGNAMVGVDGVGSPPYTMIYGISYNSRNFYTIDVSDGTTTLVGACTPFGSQSWTGGAGSAAAFWGVSTDISVGSFYSVDITTGAATRIGPTTNSPAPIDVCIAEDASVAYATDIVNDTFVQIDPTTGAGTVVGPTGYNHNFAQGMDWEWVNDDVYMLCYADLGAGIMHIDYTTGVGTWIGNIPGSQGDGLTFRLESGGTPTPTPTDTPPPVIPATEPIGLGILILALSGVLGFSLTRRK